MIDDEIMSRKPKEGYKFIYRYWDDEGSYIGQTKKSLKQRAGKNGASYLEKATKWSTAIKEKGFDSFNVEILCECPEADADNEEMKYIKQFDSLINGYNSTPGGVWYPGIEEKVRQLNLIKEEKEREEKEARKNALLYLSAVVFIIIFVILYSLK